MKALWAALRNHKAGNIVIVFAVTQIACIIASLIFPDRFAYISTSSIQTLLRSLSPIAIMAVGVGILMIAGEFDLSVGSNFAFTAYMMALVYQSNYSEWTGVACALSLGALIGLVNGLITLKAKIPSFIATLGALMFWRGILQIVSAGQTESMSPGGTFEMLFAGNIGPIQAQFIWAIAIVILGYLLLERHKLGNHIFSVGGNVESARAIGVNPLRVKMICFVIVGILAAFAGVISTARVHSVSPDQGRGYELQAIAACVIGGLSLTGGEGSVLGILLGTALLFAIQNVLLLLRAPGFYLDMFMGILIVIAVIFNRLTKKEKG
jgi:ribose/xylose/arabinose/galactoside ABC-type transport system permease subunit